MHFLDEHQLASKEVLQADKFWIAGNDGVRFLFERQKNIKPHCHFTAGTTMSGFHDPATGTSDDHPSFFRHSSAKRFRGLITRMVLASSSGAEDRNFTIEPVRGENFECVAKLLQRAAEDLEISSRSAIIRKLICRELDLVDQFFVLAKFRNVFDDLGLGRPRMLQRMPLHNDLAIPWT